VNKLRRTMLYVPGNNPANLQSAGLYGADALILDLEDAVSINEKDSARHLVRNAIMSLRYECEIAVRINHIRTPFGRADLDYILPAKPNIIRLPKAESAGDIQEVADIVQKAEERYGFKPGSIKLMAAIESAEGILNVREIAKAHPRMVAIALGGEDLIADLKTTRSGDGLELHYARSALLFAARSAKIDAIDSVFSRIEDEEAFIREVKMIKQLGFDGKSVIHPRQIPIVHQIFAPTQQEIAYARSVLEAYDDALKRKSGVVALNGNLIDQPIVTRAQRVLAYAEAVTRDERGDFQ